MVDKLLDGVVKNITTFLPHFWNYIICNHLNNRQYGYVRASLNEISSKEPPKTLTRLITSKIKQITENCYGGWCAIWHPEKGSVCKSWLHEIIRQFEVTGTETFITNLEMLRASIVLINFKLSCQSLISTL